MVFKRVKQQIPNALTFLRMACAFALLFLEPFSSMFWGLYLFAGLSDIFDGFLARKWNAASRLGASLDSAADFILIAALLYALIPRFDWPNWVVFWIAAVALIRFCSLIACRIRFHSFAFLHTCANKATGFLLLCFPVLVRLFGLTVTSILLCSAATVSAVEELVIHIRSPRLNRNARSVFITKNPPRQDASED